MTDGQTDQRIVWREPGDFKNRAVTGQIVERTEHLLKVLLPDGRTLELATAFVIKIESLSVSPNGGF